MPAHQSVITIRRFERRDQEATRNLILRGLEERFGWLDQTLNRDLDDLWASYIGRGDDFLVALADDELVGTGALIKETDDTGRIVRMSVARGWRRRGVGRMLTNRLLALGKEHGFARIVVETNVDWSSAIELYERCGFKPYDYRNGEIHMCLNLER